MIILLAIQCYYIITLDSILQNSKDVVFINVYNHQTLECLANLIMIKLRVMTIPLCCRLCVSRTIVFRNSCERTSFGCLLCFLNMSKERPIHTIRDNYSHNEE